MSGSGLFPPRLLDEDQWLTDEEKQMLGRIETLLASTGHGHNLALDMMAPRLYNIDVRIILDNSGSMSLDMMGERVNQLAGGRWIDQKCDYISVKDSRGFQQRLYNLDMAFEAMFQASLPGCVSACQGCAGSCGPNGPCPPLPVRQRIEGGIDPRHRRWFFARDHLSKWLQIYRTMGIDPPVYLLNRMGQYAHGKNEHVDVNKLFNHNPGGTTPLTETILKAVYDHKDAAMGKERSLLLLVLTDGEGDNMDSFNTLLDAIQNGAYGDVQVCLNGLSLVPEDLEWFENEECDDTRIRTIEAFEVEQQQMLRKEVIGTEGDYNFEMHVYRTLVTNLFPADYDFEAPMQNWRHRLYVTCHGKDRWFMQSCCAFSGTYQDLSPMAYYTRGQIFGCCGGPCGVYCCASKLIGVALCTPAYLATGCCCCGYCQGQECFKPRHTDGFEIFLNIFCRGEE